MESSEPRHPINYVAKRSGVTTHTIRVWERRHRAVTPVRTGKNRRLYSDADIERLRLLKAITAAGHSIGQIAQLPQAELRKLAAVSGPEAAVVPVPGHTPNADQTPEEILTACYQAIQRMDAAELEQALLNASVSLAQLEVLESLIAPLMRWVGDEWHAGRLRVAHEHLASAAVQRFLARVRASFPQKGPGPSILIATPSGQQHEIGAQLAACVAAMEGWRELYFGAGLPVSEIARVARDAHPRAIGLSLAYVGDADAITQEFDDLMRVLPKGTDVILGGAATEQHRSRFESKGASCVRTLTEFRDRLRELTLR